MKLMLSVPIEIEVVDGKKKKEMLKVEVRDFTKAEKKESKKLVDKYKDIGFRLERSERKFESVKKKTEYSEKLEKYDEALKYQETADACQEELENLLQEITNLGGEEFNEQQAQKNFDRLVSGPDTTRLAEIAESRGYVEIMKLLHKAKVEAEGKQHEK